MNMILKNHLHLGQLLKVYRPVFLWQSLTPKDHLAISLVMQTQQGFTEC